MRERGHLLNCTKCVQKCVKLVRKHTYSVFAVSEPHVLLNHKNNVYYYQQYILTARWHQMMGIITSNSTLFFCLVMEFQ